MALDFWLIAGDVKSPLVWVVVGQCDGCQTGRDFPVRTLKIVEVKIA